MIDGGGTTTCAIVGEGKVSCWKGWYPIEDVMYVPEEIEGISDAATIAIGRHNCLLIAPYGRARCWGWNEYGQLGDGTIGQSDWKPTPVWEFP
jgi:alpha-tubulin suppressor-like RCC1 family protein